MMRTTDPHIVEAAVETYAEAIEGFTIESWLSNPLNVALVEGDDAALFGRQPHADHVVFGHYFFRSKGKNAVKAAKGFLEEIFTGPYSVDAVVGLTPINHKAAIWMTRHLGFTFDGEVETDDGPYLFSILTKQEWEQLDG